MKILAHVHMAAPEHGAGAEWMLHEILSHMVRHGHDATIIATQAAPGSREFEGVEIIGAPSPSTIRCAWDWADVGITHLDESMSAQIMCSKTKTPLVHLVHNDMQLAYHGVAPGTAQLIVFNSQWLADKHAGWRGQTMVVNPPVKVARYEGCEGGDSITLANLSVAKGALTFYATARALPYRHFLAVTGVYGEQITSSMPNVELLGNQRDMRDVYRRTRVLLMPSWYESWGRCAIEAACSGIPTIAHPTPGLVEALGEQAIFVDRDNVDRIVHVVEDLYESVPVWKMCSRYSRKRALHLGKQSAVQLVELETRLRSLEGVEPEGFRRLHASQQGWRP